MFEDNFDFIIVGAGIIGLTVAYEISSKNPKSKIAIFEKEKDIGIHASGRNSGVVHSGIYYPKDTLKAKICVKGNRLLHDFSEEENIKINKCGKVILATKENEIDSLNILLKNAKDNGIKAEKIDNNQLRKIEPFAAYSYGAIYSENTSN